MSHFTYADFPVQWTVGCNAGYSSSTTPTIQTRVCSGTDGSISNSNPTCTACTQGSYCTNGVSTLCPAGNFGSSTGLSSSSCSGSCIAGYFCGAGSTSSNVNPCGAINVYCPTGSGAPITVSTNYYTTPTTAGASFRTGQSPCPTVRTNSIMRIRVYLRCLTDIRAGLRVRQRCHLGRN
jgi:hypothetical protein